MYVRILLLNDQFQTVYEMNYEYISGDISINIDSDIRNVLSMALFAKDRSVGFAEDRKLWINKFVKVFIGVKVPLEKDILWYDKGPVSKRTGPSWVRKSGHSHLSNAT